MASEARVVPSSPVSSVSINFPKKLDFWFCYLCFALTGILKGFFVALKDGRVAVLSSSHLPGPHKEERIISRNLERGRGLRRSLPAEEAALALSSGRRDRVSTSKSAGSRCPRAAEVRRGPLHSGRLQTVEDENFILALNAVDVHGCPCP